MITLENLETSIWQTLEASIAERGHEWRTPVLATIDENGLPQARTLVLRGVDPDKRQLRIFTDHRSPKVQQIRQQPCVTLLFWSRVLNWQVRISAEMSVIADGPEIDTAWSRICKSAAAFDYLTLDAPGSPLPDMEKHSEYHALAILVAQVKEIDWLELNPEGHRRARLTDGEAQWLTP